MSEKQTKSKGRSKLYTDKVLMNIIEQYLIANPETTELVANRIALFAQKELNYEKIRYTQFKSCKLTNDFIERFNVEHLKVVPQKKVDKSKHIKINTDALIDKYISNPTHLKVALRQFGDKYTDMCKESVINIGKVQALNSEIQDLKKTIYELQQQLAKVKKEKVEINKDRAKLTQRAIKGERICKFLSSIDVYADLVSRCKVNPLDEVNLKLMLYEAGLMKDEEKLDITKYLDSISNAVSLENEEDIDDTEHHDELIYFEDIKSEDDYLSIFKNIKE